MIVCIAARTLSDKAAFSEAVTVMEELGIPYRLFELNSETRRDEKRILETALSTSHTCLVPPSAVKEYPLYYFVLGLALGRGETRFVYGKPEGRAFTPMEKKACISTEAAGLREFFTVKRNEWESSKTVVAAKEELEKSGIPYTQDALFECAAEGNSRGLELFLVAGFSAQTRNKRGVPLLNLAARGGHTEAAEILLRYGADPNAAGEDSGNTALLEAVMEGTEELAEKLIQAGTNPDMRSKNGQTALILAASRGQAPVVRLLLEHGADSSIVDNLGMTALKYAELFKHTEVSDLITGVLKNPLKEV